MEKKDDICTKYFHIFLLILLKNNNDQSQNKNEIDGMNVHGGCRITFTWRGGRHRLLIGPCDKGDNGANTLYYRMDERLAMALTGWLRKVKNVETAFSKDSAWVPLPEVIKMLAILKVEAYFLKLDRIKIC